MHANKLLPVIRSIFRLLKTGDEMGDYHVQVSAWSSRFYATLTNLISLNVKAEVRGGVVTSGLFFHGMNRACTLGDNRTEDQLCSKSDCSLCAIIHDLFDISKTGYDTTGWYTP